MRYKIIYILTLTALIFSGLPTWAFAEDDVIQKEYTDAGQQMSLEQRTALSDYLCRFGACYTTDFEGDNGGKIVLDTRNWSRKMSEIIWWQFLAYSKRDRENPNAPISGQTKTVTSRP